jgi:hypothetical protein
MKTSIVFLILISASFFFSPNSQSQVSDIAVRAISSIDKTPKEIKLDIIELPISETNVLRYFEVDKVDKSETLFVYEYYDRDGNKYPPIRPPTKELRYECPVCNGNRVLQTYKFNHKTCWRCNGDGYLISNSGK